MIQQSDIESLVKSTRERMTALSVTRLSIGLQTIAHISYTDFVDAFASETETYRLGMQIRFDVNGITFSADIINGATVVEKNCDE